MKTANIVTLALARHKYFTLLLTEMIFLMILIDR